MIKAIETVYKGYRFRSRLEARWAVFFDTLGIAWEYEKEGYNLEGTWYLPDFFIPSWDAYVEIKPRHLDASIHSQDEYESYIKELVGTSVKAYKLFNATRSRVLVLQGNPYLDEYTLTLINSEPPDDGWHFALCRKCDIEIWLRNDNYGAIVLNNNPDCHTESWPIEDTPRLIAAYTAARQARFEHGEGGTR